MVLHPLYYRIKRALKIILMIMLIGICYTGCNIITAYQKTVQVKTIIVEHYCISCGEKTSEDTHYLEKYIKKPFVSNPSHVTVKSYDIGDDCFKSKEIKKEPQPECSECDQADLFFKIVFGVLISCIFLLCGGGVLIYYIITRIRNLLDWFVTPVANWICSYMLKNNYNN